jgi:hypothetical protein
MRPLLVAAGLLVLGLTAWLLFNNTQQRAAPLANADVDAAVQPAPAPGSWKGAEEVVPPPGSLERTEAEPPTADPAESFLLRVVEAESGQPIPFAEVFYTADPAALAHAEEEIVTDIFDVGALNEALAMFHRADADGTLQLPVPKENTWLVARKDDWIGNCDVPLQPPAVLEVICDWSASVSARVVNAAGLPQAGVRVNLCVDGYQAPITVFGTVTGSDGVAVIRHLETLLEYEKSRTRFLLALEGLLGASATAEFDPRAPPAEPIELRLPAHGSVELLCIRGKDGHPPYAADRAELRVVLEDDFGADSPSQVLHAKVQDGVARFAPVAVGLHLQAKAWMVGGALMGAVSGHGPDKAGETVRLDLRADQGATFLTGRLLGLDGKPLANAELDRHWGGVGDVFDPFGTVLQIGAASLKTDAAGRFRLEVETGEIEAGRQETLTLVQKLENVSGPSVNVILTGPLPLGEVALGDLRLTQASLIAAGRVVDESGAALAGVHLIANLQDEDGRAQLLGSIEYVEVTSAVDGSFELRGSAASDRLLLHGESVQHYSDLLPITFGQSGIRLVMRKFGSLGGCLIAEPGANLDGIYLTLEAIEPKNPLGLSFGMEIDGDLDFQFEQVRPGRHALKVSRSNVLLPLCVIEDLLVVSGEACVDSRLQPVNLTGMLDCISIRAQSADGLPIDEFKVITRLGGKVFSEMGTSDQPVLLPRTLSHSEVVVRAEGFLSVRLEAVTSDQTVTMQPGPRVQIVIDNWQKLPVECLTFLTITPTAPSELGYNSESMALIEAGGIADFPSIPKLGNCMIQFAYIPVAKTGGSRRMVKLPARESIEVLARTEVQTFHLTLSEDELSMIRAGLSEK